MREVVGSNLTTGKSKSCGCLQRKATSKANSIDLTGQTFGLLTVIKRADEKVGGGVAWVCEYHSR